MKTTALALAIAAAALQSDRRPLDVVLNLDLQRYAGRWYEVARFPNRFQDKCIGDVEANYTPRDDGRLTVLNRCRERDGTMTEAQGVARRVKGMPPSVLEVRFAPAFLSLLPMVWGDYQVIALDDAHTHALIGTPDRKYLWILSRTAGLAPATYERLVATAKEQGFDVKRLVRTEHTGTTNQGGLFVPIAPIAGKAVEPDRLVARSSRSVPPSRPE
jgi:apolipoprotein D and lipocalin family protein